MTSLEARTMAVTPGTPPTVHAGPRQEPCAWMGRHAAQLRAATDAHGAVLVRGLALAGAGEVEKVVRPLVGQPMREREGFAPRHRYGSLYSSAEWPHNEPMCAHHELSYAAEPPSLLVFACLMPATVGGAIGLADAAAMARALPAGLVGRFAREGWQLVRTYTAQAGMPWRDAFGSGDRAAVAAYCRDNAIDAEWRADGSLRTRQRRPALTVHPTSGVPCWFNQIAFLNEYTMDDEVREYLRSVLGQQNLPFNTSYGGGEPIPEETVRTINETYAAHTVRVPLRAGDLLVVDNVRMAHSREAYRPPREMLVAMARPFRLRADPTARASSRPPASSATGDSSR
jgi:alpha-ketoglutarate-dependent taurine dioxygenase